MGMQLLGGEQPIQMLLFEPDPLMSDRAPEEDQRLTVEPATLAGEIIQLCRFANMHPPYLVLLHTLLFYESGHILAGKG